MAIGCAPCSSLRSTTMHSQHHVDSSSKSSANKQKGARDQLGSSRPGRFLITAASALLAMLCFACNPAAVSAQGDGMSMSVYGVLQQQGQFGTFLSLVNRTGLDFLLSSSVVQTVFAPTDAAFAPLGEEELARLRSDGASTELFAMISRHIILDTALALTGTITTKQPSSNNELLRVSGSSESGYNVNGAPVVLENVPALNGYAHGISRVLVTSGPLPPATTAVPQTTTTTTTATTTPVTDSSDARGSDPEGSSGQPFTTVATAGSSPTTTATTALDTMTEDNGSSGAGVPEAGTLADYLLDRPAQFSILVDLLQATGLLDVLAEVPMLPVGLPARRRRRALGDPTPPLTFIAPVNAAFDAINVNGTFFAGNDPEHLRQTLLYHMVDGVFTVEELALLGTFFTEADRALDAFVDAKGTFFFQNAAMTQSEVLTPNVETGSGIVHVVDTLLQPALGSGPLCEVDGGGNHLPGGVFGVCECGTETSGFTDLLNQDWIGIYCAECGTDAFCSLDLCAVNATGAFLPAQSQLSLCECIAAGEVNFPDLNPTWQSMVCQDCKDMPNCATTTTTTTTTTNATTTTTSLAPVDCLVTGWFCLSVSPSGYDPNVCGCTRHCGGGVQVYRRFVLQPPANGGTACPSLLMTNSCNSHPCNTTTTTTTTTTTSAFVRTTANATITTINATTSISDRATAPPNGTTFTLAPAPVIGSPGGDATWLILLPILVALFILMSIVIGCPILFGGATALPAFAGGPRDAAVGTDPVMLGAGDTFEEDKWEYDMFAGGYDGTDGSGAMVHNAIYGAGPPRGTVVDNPVYGSIPPTAFIVTNTAYGQPAESTWSSLTPPSSSEWHPYDVIPGGR